ncbi:MAG TPA: cadmium-translocating P-type ATPase [Candidatus Acutalibacter ornithocaccae]|uniref:Cd(2+)-exporting ATPase n=1 Tax=Candidatus Acutalibacter ornithocaccae TaxID=2838416 RepID=A0A9D2LXN2_9FIRM|nr:cadmium-translocating P-type ATPase [Candidatus Acutalibacter ornithocaccae]
MTRKQKKMLVRIAVSAVLLIAAVLVPYQGLWRFALFLPAYFVIGWDVLWRAVRNIAHGQVFDENFLMALATVGAFCTGFFGQGEYPEAVFVMLFYQVGELFQSYAVGKSRKSIASLMDIRPDYANVERDGRLLQVDPEEVAVGDTITVKAGEKIPLDGLVLEGSSLVNTSALTGESVPRQVRPGDSVISGCVNQNGLLRVQVTKAFGESTVQKILDLVENASSKKAKAENFITKFARYYTPVVVFCALALAVVPPLFVGDWTGWVQKALIFLVVSCPCALVISVPLSFFGGIGGASRQGILVKGGNYLEVLADTELVVFDKTGTLTKGVFQVTAIHPEGVSQQELLELAALAESYSDHPISRSLKEAWGKALDTARVGQVEELSGRGVRAQVDGKEVWAGNGKLMEEIGLAYRPSGQVGTVVHVAAEGRYLGYILIADEVKPDAKEAIAALKAQGVKKTVLLTGDAKDVGEAVAQELGLDEAYTQLLPGDKVERVEALLQETSPKGKLAFVGDGINDAPVLSRADIGIAMGALGSDAAIEAADLVLMDDKPSKIAKAMEISKRTLRIVRQNIVFALAVKLLVLMLTPFGLANLWEAVFADVGVMVLAILNASRALQVGRK